MKHYGDITTINGREIESVDVITFGSPCQDLSLAGKRAGLDGGTRSSLFFEAIRIIKEMRDETDGMYPRFAVWENVTGAFSSNKGQDFHEVLRAFHAITNSADSIPEPDKNKTGRLVWAKAGLIVGDNSSIAWRTMDAQYWGVPQRRKRIYLVADFTGRRAGTILFEPESLRGDMSESNEAGQEAAVDAVGGIDGSVGAAGVVSKGNGECFIMPERHMSLSIGGGQAGQGYPCTVYSFDSLSSNSMKSSNPHSGCRQVEVAKCIDTTYPDPSKNQGGIAVVQSAGFKYGNSAQARSIGYEDEMSPTLSGAPGGVVALQANGIDRADTAGCNGCGWRENESYTLNTVDRHAVVQETKPPRKYIIRRLTPTECARLQGFPDRWGELAPFNPDHSSFWQEVRNTDRRIRGLKPTSANIENWYNKLRSDSAVYKAYGNGLALPNAFFVLHGIACMGAETLGSLFDGIGGFPLAGLLNDITPIWASEIEPYPIAVTVSRFGLTI